MNDTRYQRLSLAYFSFENPDLVNARLSPPPDRNIEMVSLWANNATNGLSRVLPFDEIPAEEYYSKYQTHIVMGGYGAAFRTARILGQGIAVILQEYPYEEWFTHLMVPNVHYIPLKRNLVRDNPAKVNQIAQNGKLFYDEYLVYDRLEQFYYELIFRLLLCCGGRDVSSDRAT